GTGNLLGVKPGVGGGSQPMGQVIVLLVVFADQDGDALRGTVDRRLGGLLLFAAGRRGGGAQPSLFLQFLADLRHFRRRGVLQGSEDRLQVLDVGAGLGDLLFAPFLRRLQLVVFLE